MGEGTRRALVVGVSEFGPELEPGEESDLAERSALPYVEDLAPKVARAFSALGYETDLVLDKERTTAQRLGRQVRGHPKKVKLDPDGARLVYVLSHGEPPPGGTDGLVIIGSDGHWCSDTDVSVWLGEVVNNKRTHPATLFLLDVCHGGSAARLPWQLFTADGSSRAWVIAACEQDRSAFDGRFSRALVDVLTDLAVGRLDINPTVEFVPLSTIARQVKVRVLTASQGKSTQRVTSSVLDIGADQPQWPFFRNPSFRGTPGGGQGPFDAEFAVFADELDPGVDPWHLTDRAAGLGPVGGRVRTGFFHGRAAELTALSTWMDSATGDDMARVITGAPGAGKSALLGIAVCAAHPTLRNVTQHLWAQVDDVPSINIALVAVHARYRSTADLTRSLGNQLGLAPDVTASGSPAAFIEALTDLDHVPLIALDALDEADRAGDVLSQLILPLIRAHRPDGRRAARVMVGCRTGPEWPQFDPLLAAVTHDQVMDLNSTPPDIMRADLDKYMNDLLRTRAPYNDAALAEARGRIAVGVANRLVAPSPESKRWGEFLVAGLFAHHLLTRDPPPTKADDVDALLTRIPTTLPEVLEMDLASRASDDWARPLLTTLAHAKGDGFPLDLITAVAPQFAAGAHLLTQDTAVDALAANRFYLRYSASPDGPTLYRLFHQGLTDYLLGVRVS